VCVSVCQVGTTVRLGHDGIIIFRVPLYIGAERNGGGGGPRPCFVFQVSCYADDVQHTHLPSHPITCYIPICRLYRLTSLDNRLTVPPSSPSISF
jgi:hypothetical protein